MRNEELLRLLQIADSALPIGGAAHSFGMESLVDAGFLDAENLEAFLRDYMDEVGAIEASYCAASCLLTGASFDDDALAVWIGWNMELGARKLTRESREGSAAMGRRLLLLAANVSNLTWAAAAAAYAAKNSIHVHLATAFGLAAGAMHIDSQTAATAYLQQSVTTLIYGAQRLMPLGQSRAHQILWDLKPAILNAVERGTSKPARQLGSFAPLLDLASARHATLHTRLFMS
jgi:urease accessory protein